MNNQVFIHKKKLGRYKIIETTKRKDPITREWIDVIIYMGMDGKTWVRDIEDFKNSFKLDDGDNQLTLNFPEPKNKMNAELIKSIVSYTKNKLIGKTRTPHELAEHYFKEGRSMAEVTKMVEAKVALTTSKRSEQYWYTVERQFRTLMFKDKNNGN